MRFRNKLNPEDIVILHAVSPGKVLVAPLNSDLQSFEFHMRSPRENLKFFSEYEPITDLKHYIEEQSKK